MRSSELDPLVLRRAEEFLDSGFENQGVFQIVETVPSDPNHPQYRTEGFDDGAAVFEALSERGYSYPDIRKLHNLYLGALRARRPDAEQIGLERERAAVKINTALGIRPFDQQG